MPNPWEEISLDDYENHMGWESVMQLQTMDRMMKNQLDAYPVSSVAIFGVAGGNGLGHIRKDKYKTVYGIDVNLAYLKETLHRYPDLEGILQCLRIDLTRETNKLPRADLVIANLLIEYIGYECFEKAVCCVVPQYVSCIIQVNAEKFWVSDSPYLHKFDGLDQVHIQVEEQFLTNVMERCGYDKVNTLECRMPDGKKLLQLDYKLLGDP